MVDAETRIIAVDWSGRAKNAAEAIWLAEAADGQIVQLENGRTRDQLITYLLDLADTSRRVVVGLDFAFSMPRWFVEKRSVAGTPGFWEVVASEGESWLAECPSPFYGLVGKPRAPYEQFRKTEERAKGAKSVFQIGGAGAVGTGSIRGMPLLLDLRNAGWRIWPFDPPEFPLVVEIYPRSLTGPVLKSVWRERLRYLERHFSYLTPRYTERAAGSEDAFDAAVSVLIMDQHRDKLLSLPEPDEMELVEGRIWHP
jgi:hypothetical protein